MADGFQTIGWLLTARDMATKPLRKATEFMQKAVNKTSISFAKLSNDMTEKMGEKGPIGKALIGTGRAFVNTFGSATTGAMQGTVDAATKAGGKIGDALDVGVKKSSDFINALFFKDRTFGELFIDGGKAAANFGKRLGKGLKSAVTSARSLVVGVGDVFQKLGGVEAVIKGIKKVGGIGGALLGPLGPLLDLFSPLLEMITRQFTPAIETFSAIVETAFGPFAETLEIIARNIALQLVPIIKPLGAFLELAAVQIGMLITDLLKGKPDKVFAVIFTAFKNIGPILVRVLNVLLEVGAEVGGTLLKGFLKLLPLVVKTFGSFLKAMLPLIKPLTKLAVALLEKVFIPMLEKFVVILDKNIIPFIEKWAPAAAIVIDDIADAVDDFFSNFGKYTADFKLLFIDPIVTWITATKDKIVKMAKDFKVLVVDPILDALKPVFDKVEKLVKQFEDLTGKTAEREKAGNAAAANTRAAETNRLRASPLADRAGLGNLTGKARQDKLDEYLRQVGRQGGMAAGGVVKGPISTLIGEAGPELVLPLERKVIERTLAPLMPTLDMPKIDIKIPDIQIPGLDKIVGVGEELMRMLRRGGIKVDTGVTQQERQQMAAPRPDRGNNLGMSLGMAGGEGF